MQTTPSVAIVILNYNGRHYLQQFLPSVMASMYNNKQIVVADNCSSDNSVEWLQANYPSIQIIVFKENFGFAKGYNEALKQVHADYYVLLNSDVEVTPDWIEPVISVMELDERVGACQPKLMAYHNKNLFEYAGACGGWLDVFGYPFSRGRIFDYCEEDKGQYNDVAPVFWATGAALFVRATVYHELHGLDEFFFAHQEEIDLCWRMQLSGYSIMVCPQSTVYHVGAGTLPKGGRKVFLNFRNNLVMLAKNYTTGKALLVIPFRMLLDWAAAFKGLLTGDVAFTKAILKAHYAFISWLVGSKTNNNYPGSKTGKLKGYYRGSVVWHHFVKGKKTFREIVG